MKIEKNRYLKELLFLFEASGPVTSEKIAQNTMSSVRTVKNDIRSLSCSLQAENIAEIVSHKAKGYEIKILDAKKMQEFHQKLLILYSLFSKRSIVEANRFLFIIQSLLVFGSVKKADLCEHLYVSESTLSHDIAEASDFMRSYSLNIKSLPGKGIQVEGKEQHKRSCMVEVACSSYHDIELLYPVIEFQNMFYDSPATYQRIRHAFLKMLRESRISTTDIASKKLATQLCLIRFRSASGHHPVISAQMQMEIKNTYEYELAESIFLDPVIADYLGSIPEIERINFARLLIINRDIDLRHSSDYETLQTAYVIQSNQIFYKAVEFMKQGTYRSFFEMDLFRIYELDYESLCLMIFLKNHFDHTYMRKLITYVESDENQITPVAKEITRILIEKMESLYGEDINTVEVQEISALTDYMFDMVSFPYHKLRLATSCMEGRVIGSRIQENLSKYYGDYIEYNHVYDLYEMRKISFENYDAILIASGPNLYFQYPVKMISYDGLNSADDKQMLFHELFCEGYDRKYLTELKKITNVFRTTKLHNYQDFVDTLTFKYSLTDLDQKEQWSHFEKRSKIISYYCSQSGTMVLFFDFEHSKRAFFDLYEPEQITYLGNTQEIHHVFALSLHKDIDVSQLKLLTKMLQKLTADSSYIEMMLHDAGQAWDKLLYEVLQKDFLS